MSNIKVLIITYNSFHQSMAKAIINSEFISKDSYILDHNILMAKELNSNCNYIHIGGKIFKYFCIFFWRLYLVFFIKKNQINEIIIPHLDGILSNYIYKCLPRHIKISLYHEGILSLYEFSRQKNNNFKKKLFSFFLLHRFINYENIFPVNDISINRFFTPIIKGTILKDLNKAFKIELQQFKFKNSNESTALIIGTPFICSTKLDDINLVLIKLLKSKNISKIIYKPHPVEYKSPLINSLSFFFHVSILDKNFSIEELASSIEPNIVLSFASSSFINLVPANNNIIFYSIFFKDIENVNVYKYFKNIGVNNILI